MPQSDHDRYLAAAHAVQSGVAAEQGRGSDDGTPKHLRVGINSALVANAALFTLAEYVKAQADEMEVEQARYEERLSEATGARVRLA